MVSTRSRISPCASTPDAAYKSMAASVTTFSGPELLCGSSGSRYPVELNRSHRAFCYF